MSVRDAEELKKISAFVQACRKVFPTVHKLDARALVKISRLLWKDLSLCLSTRLREIFFLPLGSRVLIGQRNFEGIVFWERACMRVYTRRGAVIREQGFAQGLVTDLENSGKLERTIGRWKTLWTMDDRGRYVFCIKVSTSNLSLYIVAS